MPENVRHDYFGQGSYLVCVKNWKNANEQYWWLTLRDIVSLWCVLPKDAKVIWMPWSLILWWPYKEWKEYQESEQMAYYINIVSLSGVQTLPTADKLRRMSRNAIDNWQSNTAPSVLSSVYIVQLPSCITDQSYTHQCWSGQWQVWRGRLDRTLGWSSHVQSLGSCWMPSVIHSRSQAHETCKKRENSHHHHHNCYHYVMTSTQVTHNATVYKPSTWMQ